MTRDRHRTVSWGLSRHTVVAWLAAGHFPERAARQRPAPKRMDVYAGELAAYDGGGGTNAAALARALRAVGYRGTTTTVRRALALLRGTRPRASTGADVGPPPKRPAVPVPSPRQVAWLLRKGEAQLTDDERAYRTALDAACPALAEARALGDRFGRMLHVRDPNDLGPYDLGPWLAAAATTDLRRFAAGIQRDRDAVLAALCFRWSNGQVEGQVHRLKLVKRSMDGRASFPLLRARVLHAAWAHEGLTMQPAARSSNAAQIPSRDR